MMFPKTIIGALYLAAILSSGIAQFCISSDFDAKSSSISAGGYNTYGPFRGSGASLHAWTTDGSSITAVVEASSGGTWSTWRGKFNPSNSAPFTCMDGSISFAEGCQTASVKVYCMNTWSSCSVMVSAKYTPCSSPTSRPTPRPTPLLTPRPTSYNNPPPSSYNYNYNPPPPPPPPTLERSCSSIGVYGNDDCRNTCATFCSLPGMTSSQWSSLNGAGSCYCPLCNGYACRATSSGSSGSGSDEGNEKLNIPLIVGASVGGCCFLSIVIVGIVLLVSRSQSKPANAQVQENVVFTPPDVNNQYESVQPGAFTQNQDISA